ncbi:Crp/Fnr family transcriptional regulator [Azohydromonas aeria]|uniref:Crp/Fnr family transcriptional regulator n=1 Tax=Azohydromonas aeria TaxID=2590212 RepID=UPI0012F9F5B8|nr:Crp/Fnr family transcriptional regulator [Azohydromonas aeria]
MLQECPALSGALVRSAQPGGSELYREGGPISDICFPVSGMLAVVVRLRDGAMANVQTVGSDGMVGLPAWMGIATSPDTVVQQAGGEVLRVAADVFREEVRHSARAQRLLGGYATYSARFSNQTCVCNTHHSVQQRLCRWLLTAADQAGAETLSFSQAMLGEMLGVRRQTVGEVLVALSQAGAIGQRRNLIRLLDRAALEQQACECYHATRGAYARLVEPLL